MPQAGSLILRLLRLDLLYKSQHVTALLMVLRKYRAQGVLQPESDHA